ncbi:relaxase/mobilization nuclease domain-containing protein [Rhodoferax koreense]|uniref:relaxase/mobilization nuclease domain-containing protein n=1 Tax=Rhodoferax koreensis TaxID=1842727 RepID=UPI0012FFC926|nr:hypothetical protein [Rhodoferax koreense]
MKALTSPRHGTPLQAMAYLLGDQDAKGELRSEVTLVRGSPESFIAFAGLFRFKEIYDSFVVSFNPGEELSAEQFARFLLEVESAMLPGMEGRVPAVVIRHGNGESQHLHILTLRIDLLTNKQCSAAAFGLRPLKQVCQLWNFRHQWADAEDPFRARLASWARPLLVLKSAPGGLLAPGMDVHQFCRQHAIQAVLANQVRSQTDMVHTLNSVGRVVSCTRRWIALDIPQIAARGKRKSTVVRLVGLLYGRDFDRARVLQMLAPTPLLPMFWRRNTPAEDARRAAILEEELAVDTRRRAAELKRRFALDGNRRVPSLIAQLFLEARLGGDAILSMEQKPGADERRLNLSNQPLPSHHVHTEKESQVHAVTPAAIVRGSDRSLRARAGALADPEVLRRTLSRAAGAITRMVRDIVQRSVGAALQAVHASAPPDFGQNRGGKGVRAVRREHLPTVDETIAAPDSSGHDAGQDDVEPDKFVGFDEGEVGVEAPDRPSGHRPRP